MNYNWKFVPRLNYERARHVYKLVEGYGEWTVKQSVDVKGLWYIRKRGTIYPRETGHPLTTFCNLYTCSKAKTMKIYCAELTYYDKVIKAVYFTNVNAAMLMCDDWVRDLVIKALDGEPDALEYKVRVMDYSDRADDILEYWQVFDSVDDYRRESAA